jgi:hypothetical protein
VSVTNKKGLMTMALQDVADWLDSLLPQSAHTGRPANKPETVVPEMNGNFCLPTSDPLLGLHPNPVFMLVTTL